VVSPVAESAAPAEATRAARAVKDRWRTGDRPDAAAVLADHPSLLRFKSVVVDLAYEEYCLREERGEAPDADAFCGRLPAYRSSVRKVLDAHRLIADHPELLDPHPVRWPEPGDQFEELRVEAELGRGSFARAYLAFDPAARRSCVLKLSPSRGGEGGTLGPLSHPHVTGLHWTRRVGGLHAVCLPLLGITTLEDAREAVFRTPPAARTAATLLDAIEADPAILPHQTTPAVVLPRDGYATAAVAAAARIADAVAYLHREGICHGDLKPANVILGPGAHPYLIDFNLAGSPAAAPAGGTLPYMAPEALRAYLGQPPAEDRRPADVYALGVILFELLTGQLPTAPGAGLTPREAANDLLARREAGADVRWPVGARVPRTVARLAERCLAVRPEDRPTAAEAASVLGAGLAVERGGRRRRWRKLAGAAVLVFACLGLLATGISLGRPRPEREPQTAAEFIERGRAHLRRNNLPLALLDFEAAQARAPGDPVPLGLSAYCLTHIENAHAIARGKQAVEAGSTSAAVYTNLGAALLQRSEQTRTALIYLDTAVELDPALKPARYNRAIARFRAATENGGRPNDLGCLDDMRVVFDPPPESAEAHFLMARMCAGCAHLDLQLLEKAIGHLNEAVRLGDDPRRYAREPVLRDNLRGVPGFDAFASMPRAFSPAKRINFRTAEPGSEPR
jgi:tetratricopeptide (TPR) repeat protein